MKTVVIVGGGALGSNLIMAVRNVGALLKLVDFDVVEKKNTLGQFHTSMGVGRKKVIALQQAMMGMWGVKIEAVPHKLTKDNATVLLSGASLVVDCVDNSEARILIQDTVRALNIPCLHGALSQDGSLGRAVWDEHFRADNMGEFSGQATCENGENLQFHILMGAYLANDVLRFLKTGEKVSYQVTARSLVRIA